MCRARRARRALAVRAAEFIESALVVALFCRTAGTGFPRPALTIAYGTVLRQAAFEGDVDHAANEHDRRKDLVSDVKQTD